MNLGLTIMGGEGQGWARVFLGSGYFHRVATLGILPSGCFFQAVITFRILICEFFLAEKQNCY